MMSGNPLLFLIVQRYCFSQWKGAKSAAASLSRHEGLRMA